MASLICSDWNLWLISTRNSPRRGKDNCGIAMHPNPFAGDSVKGHAIPNNGNYVSTRTSKSPTALQTHFKYLNDSLVLISAGIPGLSWEFGGDLSMLIVSGSFSIQSQESCSF